MLFLKRLILGFLALGFIFLGGSGTQSGSLLAQGGGFVGLILGMIVLYIFFKMAWRAMGCLPSFIMFSIVVFFILYAIGAFTNGVGNFGSSLKSFMGQGAQQNEAAVDMDIVSDEDVISDFEENIDEFDEPVEYDAETPVSNVQQQQAPQPQQQPHGGIGGGFGELINALTGQPQQQPQEEPQAFNPENYPSVYGLPRVINGDTIAIQGGYLKLFGIDAPEANQACADRHGRSYQCGREAALWLRSWITGNNVECRIVKKDKKGNMLGICSLGDYDIGAALVNAGWAVADINSSEIYAPYQRQAKANKRGLWQGKFYMPWDWRTLQTKKPKIKVIKPKSEKRSILDL
ncbi:MAG: thermonuclease family protein [Lactobacillaceae bacterium]|jgi:endonuclease YncB( thermonuclease family)|nr:thermonuclease family protein [Lactobacillaceae bacterium]